MEGGAGGVTGDACPAVPHPGGDPNPSHREREEDREREQGEPPGSDQTPDTVGLVAVARCQRGVVASGSHANHVFES